MNNKILIAFISIFFCNTIIASIKANQQNYTFCDFVSIQKPPTIKVKAVLLDKAFGPPCGIEPSASIFLFEVIESEKKSFTGRKILVVIDCVTKANEDFQCDKCLFDLDLYKTKPKGYTDFSTNKFDETCFEKYYCKHYKRS
ncbi:hypothetical protein DSECCO2_442290 [anaerobic digester metagenome]